MINAIGYRGEERHCGSGERRLGNKIVMDQDIYSMLYISTLRHEYTYYHMNKEDIEKVTDPVWKDELEKHKDKLQVQKFK